VTRSDQMCSGNMTEPFPHLAIPFVPPASVFIAPTAVILGDVTLGEDSSVWYHTVIRGDVNRIRIGRRTNIQDLCMIHVSTGTYPTEIGDDVTVGHQATLHGCTVRDRVLVGMGAIILDGAVVGEDCIVGAGTLVTGGTVIPPGSLVLGAPGRVKRSLTEREKQEIRRSAAHYVALAHAHADRLRSAININDRDRAQQR